MKTRPESKVICDVLNAMSNILRMRIANYIKDMGVVTFGEIRDNFNLNNNTLTFHLKKLKSAYIISQKNERGPYSLGELGEIVVYDIQSIIGELMEKRGNHQSSYPGKNDLIKMVTVTKCDFCDKEISGRIYGNPNSRFPSMFELCKKCMLEEKAKADLKIGIKMWFDENIPMRRKVSYV